MSIAINKLFLRGFPFVRREVRRIALYDALKHAGERRVFSYDRELGNALALLVRRSCGLETLAEIALPRGEVTPDLAL